MGIAIWFEVFLVRWGKSHGWRERERERKWLGPSLSHLGKFDTSVLVAYCVPPPPQPGDFVHTLGDAHVYLNHVEPLKQQVTSPLTYSYSWLALLLLRLFCSSSESHAPFPPLQSVVRWPALMTSHYRTLFYKDTNHTLRLQWTWHYDILAHRYHSNHNYTVLLSTHLP